jgi:2-amino-4-hydroxy-6-hydroxymethyldihydropteridine diphosphokinase
MPLYYLSLGSNEGDRIKNLRTAIVLLKERVRVKRVSSVYESEPWGYKEQRSFLNQVLEGDSGLDPPDLLTFVKGVEKKMGRVGEKKGKGKEKELRWGPRVIDIDLILAYEWNEENKSMDEIRIESERLNLPHHYLTQRNFVLLPLKEINPKLKIEKRSLDHFIKMNEDQETKKSDSFT